MMMEGGLDAAELPEESEVAPALPVQPPSPRSKEDDYLDYVNRPLARDPEAEAYDPRPLRVRPCEGCEEPACDDSFDVGDVRAFCARAGRWAPPLQFPASSRGGKV